MNFAFLPSYRGRFPRCRMLESMPSNVPLHVRILHEPSAKLKHPRRASLTEVMHTGTGTGWRIRACSVEMPPLQMEPDPPAERCEPNRCGWPGRLGTPRTHGGVLPPESVQGEGSGPTPKLTSSRVRERREVLNPCGG